MTDTIVTATEFQNHVGRYLDAAARAPVFITKHRRPVRVLLDIEDYERLRAGAKSVQPVRAVGDEPGELMSDRLLDL
jgi:prevent-host-death family protein